MKWTYNKVMYTNSVGSWIRLRSLVSLRAARKQRSDTKNYLSCLPRTVKRTNYQTVWNDSERWQTCCNALKFIKINSRYHPLQICLTSVVFFLFFFGMSLIHNIYQLYKIARFSSFFLKRDLDLWNYRRDVAFNLNYNSMHVSRQFNILQTILINYL